MKKIIVYASHKMNKNEIMKYFDGLYKVAKSFFYFKMGVWVNELHKI